MNKKSVKKKLRKIYDLHKYGVVLFQTRKTAFQGCKNEKINFQGLLLTNMLNKKKLISNARKIYPDGKLSDKKNQWMHKNLFIFRIHQNFSNSCDSYVNKKLSVTVKV